MLAVEVTLISNCFNHHQAPFCEAMYGVPGVEFHFVATTPGTDRIAVGWRPPSDCPHVVRAYESEEQMARGRELANTSDVVIIGSAPDELIIPRLKAGKLTFKYSERFYKTGTPLKRLPRDFAAAWLHHGRFQRYPLYMLCASAFTAADAARFGNYKDRCYKWGYFPEVKRHNTEALMQRKRHAVPVILWCGRLIDWKHPEQALAVAQRLKQDGYAFRMEIIGTGDMEESLCERITRQQLGDCVQLLGALPAETVREHMADANIFLFTSDRNEGWGAVLNESMNDGCAVIASHAIGSVPYLIRDGENGLVYRSGDADMLYEKLRGLLDDLARCEQLGRAAYRTMTETWNAEVAAERLLRLIAEIQRHGTCDLFADGPCSRAEILRDDWYR